MHIQFFNYQKQVSKLIEQWRTMELWNIAKVMAPIVLLGFASLAAMIFSLLKSQGVIRLMFAVKYCLLVACFVVQSGNRLPKGNTT